MLYQFNIGGHALPLIEIKHYGRDGFWKQKDFGFSLQESPNIQKIFKNLGKKFSQFDLAAIPTGAYEPSWFHKKAHINPEEAVMIHQYINAHYSVG